jgi:hypothetical protein
MKPEPDQPCLLCGVVAPCAKTDADHAWYFQCRNDECGPSEIFPGAKHRLEQLGTAVNQLCRQAAEARRKGMVLRIQEDFDTKKLKFTLVPSNQVS